MYRSLLFSRHLVLGFNWIVSAFFLFCFVFFFCFTLRLLAAEGTETFIIKFIFRQTVVLC